ncbi:MAG TPA: imidazole glycerol phosphate synthase subunit HisH [Firmicutes bacterium]|nr:imidazole glycerol phosphate synthase subunit HisH [Bacillota bacterium]
MRRSVVEAETETVIAVLDYGMGNLRSVAKALERAAQDAAGDGHLKPRILVTSDPAVARSADGIVLPGVGAFGAAMANLRDRGLDRVVREAISESRPFLGICLGLQLLFEESEERFGGLRPEERLRPGAWPAAEQEPGLGRPGRGSQPKAGQEQGQGLQPGQGLPRGLSILQGRVRRFPPGLKVPQIGWNELKLIDAAANPLWRGVPPGAYTYFVHSYYVDPEDPAVVAATAHYGVEFAAAVRRGNLFAVQFHPEKSSTVGLTMLRNFVWAVARSRKAADFVLPAVDLRGGRAVRLVQGDPARETRYADDPVAVARELVRQGARRLHVVDLDGALAGEPRQLELVARIAEAVRQEARWQVRIELGGGLRTSDDVEAAFAAGVDDVILGSSLLADAGLVAELVRRHLGHVMAGIDVRAGRVAVRGWQEESGLEARAVVRRAVALGVRRFIVTDIGRDGTLAGPNLELVRELAEVAGEPTGPSETAGAGGPVPLEFVVSGGVRDESDVEAAARLPWAAGVVVGRALYDGRVSVGQALAAARRGLVARG